jgi:pilus assembly protein CpaB
VQQRRMLTIGILAVATAAILTAVAYRSLLANVAARHGRDTTVVMAARDLPVGAMISASDVTTGKFPADALPVGALTDVTQAVGRGVIVGMQRNEVLVESRLAAEKAGAGLPALIPRNMRAVSVQVNEVIAVAGFVAPGARVDVLLTGSPNSNVTNGTVMTTTVLQNVEVLAAGQKIEPNSEGKPEKVPVITLLVSPADAQKLTLASAEGKIQLSLRNPLDEGEGSATPVLNASLYGISPPEPAKPKPVAVKKSPPPDPTPPPYSVEVIRGSKKDTSTF